MRLSARFRFFLVFLLVLPFFIAVSNPWECQGAGPAGRTPAEKTTIPDNGADQRENNGENNGENQESGEDAPIAPVNAAWEAMWSGQREMINEVRETAIKLSDSFAAQTDNLSRHLQPFEEESRRLLVFVNTFKGHPNAMEAVSRRITATIADFNHVLEPVLLARGEAQGLLQRVSHLAASLPDDVDHARFSPEMRAYINDITRARLRLTAVLAQYDSLLPSFELVKKLEDARAEIGRHLPRLWKDYYLQKPVAWLNPDLWSDLKKSIYYSWQEMILRLPVEMPTTGPQWGTAISRFFIGLFFAGILCVIIKKRCIGPDSHEAARHIFSFSLPWLVAGFALMGAAMTANGDFFRLFLGLGSICAIVGEVYLGWDLRRLQYPDLPAAAPPFLRLLPLAGCAYAVFYLPLTPPLRLVAWVCVVGLAIIWHRKARHQSYGDAQMETAMLECYPIVLWVCLFAAVSGFHIYSMLFYLLYASLAIATEASLGGMAIVSRINEILPQEGARAVLARLGVALAAPCVLVLTVGGICLWVAILPGGTYLLGEYALKGISVGATQFNIIQLLLIISVFYLTRTVVAMGTRFLSKLPQQGVHFDSTLVTPMQTAFTYASWAIFGLFVLRSLGMELSNLAMVAGGLSVGIGFGMQTIVNNFLSGLILIFGRTLQVGDVVEVGGVTGRVRKISVRATMVETYDNAMIYVPNSEFMSGRLINWTSFSRSVRRQVQVGIAYGSDLQLAIKLLVGIAKKHDNVLKYPVPSVNFADFAASSLDLRLRFWVKDFELGVSTCSDIRLQIDRIFNENHIEIAFPQLDVHLKDIPKERTAIPKPGANASLLGERLKPRKTGRPNGPRRKFGHSQ